MDMDVSIHSQPALSPLKYLLVNTAQEDGWVQSHSASFRYEMTLFSLPGLEPRLFGIPTPTLATFLLSNKISALNYNNTQS
jgi:hypothetical protein